MIRMANNLKWALRSLRRTPGFTFMAVLILALGIGANVAIFSLVDRVLVRALPYPDPDRLVSVWETHLDDGGSITPTSPADFLDWQKEANRFEALAAVANTAVNLTGGPEPVRAYGHRVSWTFFRVLGVHPALGRGFTPEEDTAGGPRALVLAHDLWMRRFGGDPTVVGRSIPVDGLDTQVVGVMPRDFRFDFQTDREEFLVPIAFTTPEREKRGWHFLGVVGRLAPATGLRAGQEELRLAAAHLAKAYPDSNRNRSVRVFPLREEFVRDTRSTLLFLMGAVGFVLLVACANLLNLMLARKAQRQKERAIRAALGASPFDLLLQELTESAVLGLLGGAAGFLLAQNVLGGLVNLLEFPDSLGTLGWDPRLAGFAFLLSLATALVLGLVPALKGGGDQLKEGRSTGAGSHHRLRGLLVGAELALTTLLLIGAGLMVRSLHHLQTLDPGFRPDHVLRATLSVPVGKYPALGDRAALALRLQARVAAVPGVASAAVIDTLPLGGSRWTTSYEVEGRPAQEGRIATAHHVSPGYFRAMGIPLLAGRELEPGEVDGAVVSLAFARKQFGTGDPLLGRLALDGSQGHAWVRVVGVAGDVRSNGLGRDVEPELYFPLAYGGTLNQVLQSFSLVARCGAQPEGLVPALKAALRDVDPDLPLGSVRTLDSLLARDRQATHAGTILLGVFATLALLLAGVGTYAVLSFLTSLRAREMGIRMALGAQARDILALVLGQGLWMVGVGIACGLVGSLFLGRFIQAQLHGVRGLDPATHGVVVLLLALVGLAACLLPSLRALRTRPAEALRHD